MKLRSVQIRRLAGDAFPIVVPVYVAIVREGISRTLLQPVTTDDTRTPWIRECVTRIRLITVGR